MIRGPGHPEFDISDVASDTLSEALEVAVDVLRDHGDTPGNTRIERLARFVVRVLGADESSVGATGVKFTTALAEHLLDKPIADVRALAVSLIRYADVAEGAGKSKDPA